MSNESDLRVKEVIVDSRINKVLAMRTDSVPMLEALDAISEFYVTNTIDSRRLLRQDLEMQNVNLAKKFLEAFDVVKFKISEVEDLSKNLEDACTHLASRVKDADENMKSFMEKASHLENRRNFFSDQSKEISSFLSRFQLSNEEIDLLYNVDLNVSSKAHLFFEALQRLKTAYSDCKVMVEKHCYSVGFELLEVLGQHQDMAYQHLFDWVKNKCNSLAETGAIDDYDTNLKLQVAIRFLKKLPIYFSQCQDLLVNSRRTQLVQRFISALTQGETTAGHSNKSLRAIDLHSHDAVRYVGGMLAWTHQAVASELEFLEAIFEDSSSSDRNNRRSGTPKHNVSHEKTSIQTEAYEAKNADGNTDSAAEVAPSGLSIPELLAHCLQGIGRPLRVRIVQTIETKASLPVLYGLIDLLTFYEQTFGRILSIENAIHSAIKGCLLECKRSFLSILNKQADSMTSSPVSYPADLKASHVTRECTTQVHEMFVIFGNALSSILLDTTSPVINSAENNISGGSSSDNSGDESEPNKFHIDTVLGSIIQPLLQSCRLGGQALQEAEMAIYMLNNISIMQHEIAEAARSSSKTSYTSSWLSMLQTESSTWIDILVREEVVRTLRRSDMDKLLEIIEVVPKELRACEQVGLSQDRVGTIVRAFYASLFSTFAPQFERLQDPGLRELIRVKIAQRVYEAHLMVHQLVSQESNGYDRSMLAHSVEEVGVLLGCDAADLLLYESSSSVSLQQ